MAVVITKQAPNNFVGHNQGVYVRVISTIGSTKKFYLFDRNNKLVQVIDAYLNENQQPEAAIKVSNLFAYNFPDNRMLSYENYNRTAFEANVFYSTGSYYQVNDVNSISGSVIAATSNYFYGNKVEKFPAFLTNKQTLKWVRGQHSFITFNGFALPPERLTVTLRYSDGGFTVISTSEFFDVNINYSGCSIIEVVGEFNGIPGSEPLGPYFISCEEYKPCSAEKLYSIHFQNKYGGLETMIFSGTSNEVYSYDRSYTSFNRSYLQAEDLEDGFINTSFKKIYYTLRSAEMLNSKEFQDMADDFFYSPYYYYIDVDDNNRLKYIKMVNGKIEVEYNSFGIKNYFIKAEVEIPTLTKSMQV